MTRKFDLVDFFGEISNIILIFGVLVDWFPILSRFHRRISKENESGRYENLRSLLITGWGTTGVEICGELPLVQTDALRSWGDLWSDAVLTDAERVEVMESA